MKYLFSREEKDTFSYLEEKRRWRERLVGSLFTQGRGDNILFFWRRRGGLSFFQQGVHGNGPNPFLDVREDEVSSYLGERRPLLFSREEGTNGGRLA